jgi:hypothetical protein
VRPFDAASRRCAFCTDGSAALAFASVRARTSTLDGFAAIVISSPVGGLHPVRFLVASALFASALFISAQSATAAIIGAASARAIQRRHQLAGEPAPDAFAAVHRPTDAVGGTRHPFGLEDDRTRREAGARAGDVASPGSSSTRR